MTGGEIKKLIENLKQDGIASLAYKEEGKPPEYDYDIKPSEILKLCNRVGERKYCLEICISDILIQEWEK